MFLFTATYPPLIWSPLPKSLEKYWSPIDASKEWIPELVLNLDWIVSYAHWPKTTSFMESQSRTSQWIKKYASQNFKVELQIKWHLNFQWLSYFKRHYIKLRKRGGVVNCVRWKNKCCVHDSSPFVFKFFRKHISHNVLDQVGS